MINNDLKNVLHNASYLLLTQGAMYIAPLLILSYLLKTLGVQQFGYYALILAVVAYLQIINDYGFSFSSSRAISQGRENKELISEIYLGTIIIKIIISIILFLFYYSLLSILPIDKKLSTGLVYGYLLVLGNTFQSQWFYQGIEKLKIVALLNLISRLCACVLVFIFVKNENDMVVAILVQSIPIIVGAIVLNLVIVFHIKINVTIPSKKLIFQILKDGKDFFLASLYAVVLNNSGVFILGFMTNTTIVGIYAAAEKITKAVLSLFTPLTQAIYPYNCRRFSLSLNDGLISAKKTGVPIAILALLASLSIIVLAPNIIAYLRFPKETVLISQILSFWLFFGVINNVLGIQILSASGKGSLYSRLVLISASFTILLMVLLTYRYTASGVAFAIMVGELLLSIMLVMSINRKLRNYN